MVLTSVDIFDSLFLGCMSSKLIHDCLSKCTKDNIHVFLAIDITEVITGIQCMHCTSVPVMRCVCVVGICLLSLVSWFIRHIRAYRLCVCCCISFSDHSTESLKVGVRWKIVHKDLVASTASNFMDYWHQDNAVLPLRANKSFMNKFVWFGVGNQWWKPTEWLVQSFKIEHLPAWKVRWHLLGLT